MEALVWVLAGIVLFDVAIVVVLGLRAEVARRRDRREVRELERLYESPPASSPTTMQGSAGVGFPGGTSRSASTGPAPSKHRPFSVLRPGHRVDLRRDRRRAAVHGRPRRDQGGLRADTVVRGPLPGTAVRSERAIGRDPSHRALAFFRRGAGRRGGRDGRERRRRPLQRRGVGAGDGGRTAHLRDVDPPTLERRRGRDGLSDRPIGRGPGIGLRRMGDHRHDVVERLDAPGHPQGRRRRIPTA